ncbi:MAG: hypothetical protein AAF546_05790 [Verrucomicrobiota bacterium]
MDKLRALLLPLALVFGAIAVFEFGARYGAANMRAFAIAGELQLPLNLYSQGQANMDPQSKDAFALMIDNGIAAGVLQRELWYISKNAKSALDKVIAYGFSIRGDAIVERFRSAESSEDLASGDKARMAQILAALEKAKDDLVDQSTETEKQDDSETAQN